MTEHSFSGRGGCGQGLPKHKVVRSRSESEFTATLDECAADGWEVISANAVTMPWSGSVAGYAGTGGGPANNIEWFAVLRR